MTKQTVYNYEDFLKVLQKINPVAYAIIKPHAQVIKFSSEGVILGFKSDMMRKALDSKSESIDKASREYFGKPVTFWTQSIKMTEEEKLQELERENASNYKKKWTRQEKKFLRENYASLPNEVLAKHLHRTPLAVQLQASVMGVKKRPKRKAPKPITVATELDWSDIKKPELKRFEGTKTQPYLNFIIANIILCMITLFILIFML